jgi:hypothetical protein
MNLAFLALRCWMDSDGSHVWQSHECKGKEVESMLPNPPWRIVGPAPYPGLPGRVEPSIICDGCGLHAFGRAEVRP